MAVRIIEMQVKQVGSSWLGLPSTPFVAQTPITANAGGTAQSAAFGGSTNIVSVEADEDVHVNFDANPTATTAHPKIKAGTSREFLVTPGHKVAARTA